MRRRFVDIDDRMQDLAELLRADPIVAEEFLRKYEFTLIYHENALEGVIFSKHELETALTLQPLADVAAINALRDIRNYKAALEVVRAEAAARKPKITHSLVNRLYTTLHAGVESRATPELRKDIPLHRAYFHDIAQPGRIAGQLDDLLAWTESHEFAAMHVIPRATRFQHAFMQVYPFTDGSGKIARLLANMLLLHESYQPCVIHTIDRQRYYESLRHPDTQLRELVLESLDNGLTSGEKFVLAARAARRQRRSVA